MPIVTLSRQLGAGGSEIAAGVAKALGLRIIDGETIDQAARRCGVPELALDELGFEGRRGLILHILSALKAAPAIPSLVEMERHESLLPISASPPRGSFTPALPLLSTAMDDYVRMIGIVLQDMARENNVLIIGRASQMLLRDNQQALHLQVVAPLPRRVAKLMAQEPLSQREATQRILASDEARREYLRRYFGVNWLDPQLYDLIINTGRVSISTAVQLVVMTQVQRLVPEASPTERRPDLGS